MTGGVVSHLLEDADQDTGQRGGEQVVVRLPRGFGDPADEGLSQVLHQQLAGDLLRPPDLSRTLPGVTIQFVTGITAV